MEAVFYIFAKVISLMLSVVSLTMFARVIMQLIGMLSREVDELEKFFLSELAKINQNLASFKQVNRVEIVDHEFEKTTSRKIIRYLVK